MNYQGYKSQVALLLEVLPAISLEECFALHGGTAINLFVRNMPRLSVDIDLTYLPVENRNLSLEHIHHSLQNIKSRLVNAFPTMRIRQLEKEAKLFINKSSIEIKVEVNTVKRGCYASPVKRSVCLNAQEEFDRNCEIQVVETGHLFGGKICAALDRQHPRDLFDIRYMLENEGLSKEIVKGFIFYLISSNRPINELLFPKLKDEHLTLENQFTGMTTEDFNYDNYEDTRGALVKGIHKSLTLEDKEFLLRIEEGYPNWAIYDFKKFPAVQWKLDNIENLKVRDPKKHKQLYEELESNLFYRVR